MEPDQVTDIIHSPALFSYGAGPSQGYAFLCTNEHLAGCKRMGGPQFVEHAPLSDAGRRRVTSLLDHCQFDVPYSEVESVEVRRSRFFKPGAIVIRARSTEHKIGVAGRMARYVGGGPDPDSVQNIVMEMIGRHVSGQIIHET